MGETPPDVAKTLKEIVFGTRIARVVENEDPATIVQITRRRIWDNIESFLLAGDWPDRPRTADEIDSGPMFTSSPLTALMPPERRRRTSRRKTPPNGAIDG